MDFLFALDRALFLGINHLPHTIISDSIAQFFSGVGAWGVVWFVIVLYLFFREERRDHWFFVPSIFASVSTVISEYVLKALIARPRPSAEMGALIVGYADNFSFPSSHATLAFAFATLLSGVEKRWKWWLYALASFIALSRIYLGVHYPLDIIGGSLLGYGIGVIGLRMERIIHSLRYGPTKNFIYAVHILAIVGIFIFTLDMIRVERDILQRPAGSMLDFQIETKKLQVLFAQEPTDVAYKLFTQMYHHVPPYEAYDMAHIVGTMLYKKHGKKGLQYCTRVYGGGCYRGFFFELASTQHDASLQECNGLAEDIRLQCVQGFGHGILSFNEYSIDGLSKALAVCSAFEDKKEACDEGVFTEYNTKRSEQLAHGTRQSVTLDKEKIYEPCISLSAVYQPFCFLDQPPRWFVHLTTDANTISGYCHRIADVENRIACYRGMARITPHGITDKFYRFGRYCMAIHEYEGWFACLKELW